LPGIRNGAHAPWFAARGTRRRSTCLDLFGAQVMASHANSQFSEVCVDFIEFDGLATAVAANIKRFEELYPR
jgi:hypothetical protein